VSHPPLVAIVGNPNSGKTTIFNALTGSRQKVGNYPGVTVERVTAILKFEGRTIECMDVPGLYSLNAVSEDERVAAEAIFQRPALTVVVLDAANLERNLFLFTQLAELQTPLLVVLTMVDRVRARGGEVDLSRLSAELGVDVLAVDARSRASVEELRTAIATNLAESKVPHPALASRPIAALRERLARLGMDATLTEVAEHLADPDKLDPFPELVDALGEARSDPGNDAASRYEWAERIAREALTPEASPKASLTDRIDAFLTHRVFGLIVFVALMYGVFFSIYTLAGPFMEAIEAAFGLLGERIGPRLESAPLLQSLVVDGIIGGVGGVIVFLPQILILFFFIAVLEGSGYLARAAFLMDRLLGWCGLNGRAFIPLLSSFACAIPGIMAARVMPDQRSRLATILVAPLMSCSARLPVYILLIGAFIQPKYGAFWAGFALFAMHFLGLIVAIPIAWALNRGVLKGKRLPFLLELPPYQWPRWRDVWLAMYFRGKVFLKTAGTVIFLMSVVIWAMSTFPQLDDAEVRRIERSVPEEEVEKQVGEAKLANSALGRIGKAIEPAFLPAGFDWRITTSILAAFPAREVVVPSLGIIFAIGGEVDEESPDLRSTLAEATWPDGRPLMTVWTATGLMAFFALCAQCMATLATVRRETNSWKWPAFMFVYMTGLAYLVAVLINQIGRMVGG
jgi:ferrous iron transport protein B